VPGGGVTTLAPALQPQDRSQLVASDEMPDAVAPTKRSKKRRSAPNPPRTARGGPVALLFPPPLLFERTHDTLVAREDGGGVDAVETEQAE
jgi:hypothetical protein